MVKLDYIVVGCGLAGIAFCEELRKAGKSFLVFDDDSQRSSKTAAGLYNPVVLKRFTAAWKAKELLPLSGPYYYELERYLKTKFINEVPIFRRFNSVEEQNDWFAASDKLVLSDLLSMEIQKNTNPHINAEFGLGEVKNTGWINTNVLIDAYTEKLIGNGLLTQHTFDYHALEVDQDQISYQDLVAGNVVFSDGFGARKNPYFNVLPLIGNKGEYIVISAPDLKLQSIIKASVFIIPLGHDTYLIGATYNNTDKTQITTEEARQELMNKIGQVISCDFRILDQLVGIRPTVKDRRPLVGHHPKHKNLSILNGLGTRGVMASPYVAKQLYAHIEKGSVLDPEIDVLRYENLFLD